MNFTEKEIINASGAKVLKNSVCQREYSFSTDTRTIKKGEIYIPLKGEIFDGEKFIQNAIDAGAYGYFTTSGEIFDNAEIVLKVDDTLKTYLALAKYARNKLNLITIGITGSSGKTTTKEIVYSVLSQKFKTHKTFSNHNNEIGLCQTILGMSDDTEALIVEMGMRGLGEIEILSKYSEPDYTIITNAGSAHIGRLGSLDNIARAKSEISLYQRKNGALIANDNERLKKFANYDGEQIWYSLINVKVLEQKPGYSKFVYKDKEYELNVEGAYNIENSLAAIELAYKLKMSYDEIKAGLLTYKPIEKRWEVKQIGNYKIINDSYNANPESMKASVSTFVELYKNPVVILGGMGELGNDEVELHKEVGNYLSIKAKNAKYFTVGALAKKIGDELFKNGIFVKNFENNDEVSRYILENDFAGCTIFLKASRAMKFEEIIENLKRRQ